MRSSQKDLVKFVFFKGIASAIWVFFRALKSKSEYFLGFSKQVSDEHTYHFYVKSASPGFWLSPQVKV